MCKENKPAIANIDMGGTRRLSRAWLIVVWAVVLSGCAAALIVAAGGSLSSSLASAAVFILPGGDEPRISKLLPFGVEPNSMALDPNGGRLAVGESVACSVALIDTVALEAPRRVQVNECKPEDRWFDTRSDANTTLGVVYAPSGNEVYAVMAVSPWDLDPRLLGVPVTGVAVIDPDLGEVTRRIDTKGSPYVAAVSPEGDRLYVGQTGIVETGTVVEYPAELAVLDLATDTVERWIPTGDFNANAVVVSTDGDWVVVANNGDPENSIPGTVTLIDTTALEAVATLTVGLEPTQIALQGMIAYVVNRGSGTVSIVDMKAQAVVGQIDVGGSPLGLALDDENDRLYVSSHDARKVTVFDTRINALAGEIPLNDAPGALALSADGSRLFAALPDIARVAVVDLPAGATVARIAVGDDPVGVALEEDLAQGYALASGSGDLSVFDTDTLQPKAVIAFELHPYMVTVDPVGGDVYVANGVHNSVMKIDPASGEILDVLRVGLRPIALTLNPANRVLWVLNSGDDTVMAVDLVTGQSLLHAAAGKRTQAISLSPDGTVLYVLGEELIALDTQTGQQLGTWSTTAFHWVPTALAMGPTGRYLYLMGVDLEPFVGEVGVVVSRLDRQSDQLALNFSVQDFIGVGLAVDQRGRVLISGWVRDTSVFFEDYPPFVLDVNPEDLADFNFVPTDAGDFSALASSTDRLFVSAAIDDGRIDRVDLTPLGQAFSTPIDGPVKGLAVDAAGSRVYGALSYLEQMVVVDAATGALLDTWTLPRVQRFD